MAEKIKSLIKVSIKIVRWYKEKWFVAPGKGRKWAVLKWNGRR